MENNKLFDWYMISTVSGKEAQVIESLRNRIKSEQLEDFFQEVKMFETPHLTQRELEKKFNNEAYKVKKENLYKGYIFINMIMTDEAWFMVRNTQYVTGLIGSSGKGAKPTPVSQKEINKMFEKESKLWDDFDKGIIETPFKIGTLVEVIEGPYLGEKGFIVDVEISTYESWVEVETFGKKTPTKFSNKILKVHEK